MLRRSDLPPDPRRRAFSDGEIKKFQDHLDEMTRRGDEALRLYEPLKHQQEYHSSRAKEVIMRKANQAGGSLAGFAEDARALLGCDPYEKYPKTDGIMVCIGYGESHVGHNIHRYLFRPGAFWCIRDEDTGKVRTFHPWPKEAGGDLHRDKEKFPAPPLIPERFIKTIAWISKARYIFDFAELTTGWVVYARNSAGDPNQFQGNQLDMVHIDEDVQHPGWYTEMTARLSIRKGLMRWTALPHMHNDAMMRMLERAEDQRTEENPQTVLVTATMYDNPYYPEESKQQNERLWRSMGDDEYEKRALGKLVLNHYLMYPSFHRDVHSVKKYAETAWGKVLAEHNWEPPADWTRFMITDPGHTVCATLFAAVPPTQLGNVIYVYRENYLLHGDAKKWMAAVEGDLHEHCFYDYLFDMHGGKLRELGSGILPYEHFSNQLKSANLPSVKHGFGFAAGCDEVEGREMALRQALHVRDDMTPGVVINVAECPNLVKEMERFRKLETKDSSGNKVVTDKGNRRGGTHAIECLEMLVSYKPVYVKPKSYTRQPTSMEQILKNRAYRRAFRAANFGATPGINLSATGAS